MNDTTIPLATIAAELGISPDGLARKLNGQIGFDPTTGLRVVSACTCLRLITEAASREEARQRAAEQRRVNTVPSDTPQRVQAIASAQARMRANGEIDDGTPSLAIVLGAEHQAYLDRRGRDHDRLRAATGDVAGFGGVINSSRTREE